MFILERYSYGSKYNNIFIDPSKNLVKKVCYNNEGLKKIKCEMNFFRFLMDKEIKFPIPKIISYGNNYYEMEYLKNYSPLYKIFELKIEQEKKQILENIYSNLNHLHTSFKKQVSRDEYKLYLEMETKIKILERFNKIRHIIEKYSFIKKVNGLVLNNFINILDILNKKIDEYINKKTNFEIVLIHGDCQFNNILIEDKNNNIIFIDPRGFFGNSELFGIVEYDYAKIKFALSGYDKFDNMDIKQINIQDDNIYLETSFLDKIDKIFNDDLETLLMLTIWLGNPHSFIENEFKTIYSFFLALYFSTLQINMYNYNN